MVNNKKEYFIVNLIFILIIGVVFGYSYFFYPNNQPIQCIHKLYTGHDCSSCGFSRAFSSFMHLNYTEGSTYNRFAFNCFLFFLFQFALRGTAIILYLIDPLKPSRFFILTELILTVLFFLAAFFPLLMN
jgi:hypothetical protein